MGGAVRPEDYAEWVAKGGQVRLSTQALLVGWPTATEWDSHREIKIKEVEAQLTGEERYIGTLGMRAQMVAWPTPTALEAVRGQYSKEFLEEVRNGRTKNNFGMDLGMAAQLVGWGTPRAREGMGHNGNAERSEVARSRLEDQVMGIALAGWTTPSARDWKDSPGMSHNGANPDGTKRNRFDQLPRQIHGVTLYGFHALMEDGAQLAPSFVAWLMGFPKEWLACSPKS